MLTGRDADVEDEPAAGGGAKKSGGKDEGALRDEGARGWPEVSFDTRPVTEADVDGSPRPLCRTLLTSASSLSDRYSEGKRRLPKLEKGRDTDR